MRLTAMDINSKEFKKSIRGYDASEVDDFLDKIAEDYEAMYKENTSLKDKLEAFEDRINHYSRLESTIQSTLIMAQNAAEQTRSASHKEAELIIKTANETAQKIVDKANNDIIDISSDYDTIKKEFAQFRSKYKNFINTQVELFNNLENEFVKQYNLGRAVDEEAILEAAEAEAEELLEASLEEELSKIKNFNVEE